MNPKLRVCNDSLLMRANRICQATLLPDKVAGAHPQDLWPPQANVSRLLVFTWCGMLREALLTLERKVRSVGME